MMDKHLRSVLIVDDSEADREYCEIMFTRAGGYGHVLTARNGSEALEMFQDYNKSRAAYPEAFPPVVIFLDINMPRMDGFEFLSRLVELPCDEQNVVVMLSSSDDEEEIEKALAYDPVKEYLVKPMTVKEAQRLRETYGT